MIDVRGKKVPYAKAPRSHGGGGMGGLGIFEVIVGGLGAVIAGGGLGGGGRGTPQHPRRAPAPQRTAPRDPGRGLDVDWGGGLGGRRQRRSGGTFGPDLTPSPRTRRKRSRTRKSKGSARRSR